MNSYPAYRKLICRAVILSGVNQFMVYDFGCAVSDGIHLCNPFHLVLRFKLFRTGPDEKRDEITGKKKRAD